MTILQSLARYYDRLPNVAPQGWSREPIGLAVTLSTDGHLVDVEPWGDPDGKKFRPRIESVPKWFGRSGTGSTPFFLWDNTGYVLGVTRKPGDKVVRDHAAFRELHQRLLADSDDEGLTALLRFLEAWRPDHFTEPFFKPDYLDLNVAFRLQSELGFIHQRPAAQQIVEKLIAPPANGHEIVCLVTGRKGPGVRLHPKIKNVDGTAAAEVPLVSFNSDAFESYEQKQGENAPTSEAAAFKYGTALNQLLTRNGPNRLRRPIGDATVVFWAEAGDPKAAEAADEFAFEWLQGDPTDETETARIRDEMEKVAAGRPISDVRAGLDPATLFHVLGLSPNAARLSVRFWLTDSLDHFARSLAQHHQDMRIDPLPYGWGAAPSVGRLLANSTALQRDSKNIPPLLAGEVMRAVLTGSRYPQSLLAAALMRLRAGDPKTRDGGTGNIGWHAAVLRGVLFRKQRQKRQQPDIPEKGETPMALDREHRNIGYVLGRLFATYELAQVAALGRGVKATMRDKYFASASSTPASVFPLVIAHGQNHLAKARKTPSSAGWAYLIERELNAIMDVIEPALPHSLPRSLRLEDQAEFAIGYYHQRSTKLKSKQGDEISLADEDENAIDQGDSDDD